jgi:hypothetical protein
MSAYEFFSLSLTVIKIACKPRFMKYIHRHIPLRLVAAMLVAVAVISLSTLATHAPAQKQTWITLKSIRTDKATAFYADTESRANRAWFVEMVLPTGHYADNRANRAWFVEMVLPTGDNTAATENLKSLAATL